VGGKLFVTQAIAALAPSEIAALVQAVREFDDFTRANDPHGQHDFGSLSVAGQTFFWKIDVTT